MPILRVIATGHFKAGYDAGRAWTGGYETVDAEAQRQAQTYGLEHVDPYWAREEFHTGFISGWLEAPNPGEDA